MAVYGEIWDGPARNYRRSGGSPVTSRKRYVCVHNTSNDASAEGEASYAKRRTDGTSSHYYADSNSLVQSLDTLWCAGHVGSHEGNTYGISYEITGFNGWSRAQWLDRVAWDLVAKQMARDCREHGIQVRLLSIAQMRNGRDTGFHTHDMARRAWGGTDHTDPGPGFPMDHLLALVREHMDGDDDMSAQSEAQINTLYELLVDGRRTQGAFTHTPAGGPWAGKSQPINPLYHAIWQVADALGAPSEPVDVDEAEIVRGILSALTPEAIADAIGDEVAVDVLDLLKARLAQ